MQDVQRVDVPKPQCELHEPGESQLLSSGLNACDTHSRNAEPAPAEQSVLSIEYSASVGHGRSTSSGRSRAADLMAGIMSSSPRTRLHADRYTAFLIMPATLPNSSAAAVVDAAVAAVPHIDCVGDESSCLAFSLPENETPAGDDQHRSAC